MKLWVISKFKKKNKQKQQNWFYFHVQFYYVYFLFTLITFTQRLIDFGCVHKIKVYKSNNKTAANGCDVRSAH